MLDIKRGPLFPLGRLLMTPNAQAHVPAEDVKGALTRHGCCDWGEVDADDWKENDVSLRNGFRLLSAYQARDGTKFWIITEADRSITTILLPEDY